MYEEEEVYKRSSDIVVANIDVFICITSRVYLFTSLQIIIQRTINRNNE